MVANSMLLNSTTRVNTVDDIIYYTCSNYSNTVIVTKIRMNIERDTMHWASDKAYL